MTRRPVSARVGNVKSVLAAKMDRERELKIIRRAYAKQVTAAASVGDPQVETAFAAVGEHRLSAHRLSRWASGIRGANGTESGSTPDWPIKRSTDWALSDTV